MVRPKTIAAVFCVYIKHNYYSVVFNRVNTMDIQPSCKFDNSHLFYDVTNTTAPSFLLKPDVDCKTYMQNGSLKHVYGVFLAQLISLVFQMITVCYETATFSKTKM